jgi:hypothetical protein
MAQAGREHVCRYHTYQALRDYLLAETLQMGAEQGLGSKGAGISK